MINTCQALRRKDVDAPLEFCTETAICIVTAVQEGKFMDVPMCHTCWCIAHKQESIVIHYVKPITSEEA